MSPIDRFFRVLDDGSVFKWLAIALLALVACFVGLSAVVGVVGFLGLLRFTPTAGVLGLLALSGGYLLATLVQLFILVYRGMLALARSAERSYSVIALVAKVVRVSAESSCAALLILSPAVFLGLWLTGESLPVPMAPVFGGRAGFLGGLLAWILGTAFAFAALFVGYLFAEMADRFVWLTDDMRRLRQHFDPA